MQRKTNERDMNKTWNTQRGKQEEGNSESDMNITWNTQKGK